MTKPTVAGITPMTHWAELPKAQTTTTATTLPTTLPTEAESVANRTHLWQTYPPTNTIRPRGQNPAANPQPQPARTPRAVRSAARIGLLPKRAATVPITDGLCHHIASGWYSPSSRYDLRFVHPSSKSGF